MRLCSYSQSLNSTALMTAPGEQYSPASQSMGDKQDFLALPVLQLTTYQLCQLIKLATQPERVPAALCRPLWPLVQLPTAYSELTRCYERRTYFGLGDLKLPELRRGHRFKQLLRIVTKQPAPSVFVVHLVPSFVSLISVNFPFFRQLFLLKMTESAGITHKRTARRTSMTLSYLIEFGCS